MPKSRPPENSGMPLRDPRDRFPLGPLPLDPVVPPAAATAPPSGAGRGPRGPTGGPSVRKKIEAR